jgi:uncharacterized protein
MSFTYPELPAELSWKNEPLGWSISPPNSLNITAGPKTDLFNDPGSSSRTDTAPVALFTPPDTAFILSAKVTVGFGATYDAGTLQIRKGEDLWGKLCFEYSPQGKPTIVSVVTRGLSDDCNSTIIEGNQVYLRVASTGQTIAFHYSVDGRHWHLVRYFALGGLTNPQAGFSAQSPTGEQCQAWFTEINYRAGVLNDLRNGE